MSRTFHGFALALLLAACATAPKVAELDSKIDLFSESKKVVLLNFKVLFRTRLTDFTLPDDFYQSATDEMYADYVARLKASGFEIIERTAVESRELREYLASDKMTVSPKQRGGFIAFAPTGWKLEESTIEPALSSPFGTTLADIGGRVSRRDDVLYVMPTIQVDLPTAQLSQVVQYGYGHEAGVLRTKPVLGEIKPGERAPISQRVSEHFGLAQDFVFQTIREGRSGANL